MVREVEIASLLECCRYARDLSYAMDVIEPEM
jgi:hypothetical protein